MTAQPSPNGDQDMLYQLVDAWLDAEPGSPRREQLAARLASSPEGRMWLATRDTLVNVPGTPDLVTSTTAKLHTTAVPVPMVRRETPTQRLFFGTLVTVRQRAALVMAVAAMAAGVAGVLLLPAADGGLWGAGGNLGQSPVGAGSVALLVLAAVLGVAAAVMWRRK